MVLIGHIILALSGLVYSTLLFVKPSQTRLNITYGLATGTLISGIYLIVSLRSHILQSCIVGVLYLGIVTLGIVSARRKLLVYAAHK